MVFCRKGEPRFPDKNCSALGHTHTKARNELIVCILRMGIRINFTGANRKELLALCEEMLTFLNGDWHAGFFFIHVCTGRDCCPGGLPESLRRLETILRKILLRSRPPAPQKTKWFPFAAALDFWLLALCLHTAMLHLIIPAMRLETGDLTVAQHDRLGDGSWNDETAINERLRTALVCIPDVQAEAEEDEDNPVRG